VTTGWSPQLQQDSLWSWSSADGWREEPVPVADREVPLAVLPDGRLILATGDAIEVARGGE
jgi:hypothetical protein